MRVGRRLWNEDTCVASAVLDEMVRSDIRHDLSTGQDLSVELGLDLVKLLLYVLELSIFFSDRCQNIPHRCSSSPSWAVCIGDVAG